jgi:hypothetical protein
MTDIVAKPPMAMSNRARAYLIVATIHFLLIGISILGWPEMYAGAAFMPLAVYTHLIPWGIAYTLTGAMCGLAAVTKWPTFARAGLVMAFVVLMVTAFAVGWGVVLSWMSGVMVSPLIPIGFAALGIKDLLIVGQPLRTPFEDYQLVAHEIK